MGTQDVMSGMAAPSSQELPGSTEVVVIGAGANGLATARSLATAGHEVVVLEQASPGHLSSGSHGDARVFAYVHPEPEWVPMCVEAMTLWRQLEQETGSRVLDDLGGLYATSSPDPLTAILSAQSVDFEVFSAAEGARRFPVTVGTDMALIHTPDSGTFAAELALKALADSATAHRARILGGVTVNRIRVVDEGVVISTSAGDIAAKSVVVTAGAWTSDLVRPLGIDVPTKALRGTVAYFSYDDSTYLPPLFEEGRPNVYSAISPAHGLKMGESRVGSYVPPGEMCEPDLDSVARLAQRVRERFPTASPDDPHIETCLFTYTPDVTFRLEAHGPVVIGVACEGRGFKFAPVTGAQLATLTQHALAHHS